MYVFVFDILLLQRRVAVVVVFSKDMFFCLKDVSGSEPRPAEPLMRTISAAEGFLQSLEEGFAAGSGKLFFHALGAIPTGWKMVEPSSAKDERWKEISSMFGWGWILVVEGDSSTEVSMQQVNWKRWML